MQLTVTIADVEQARQAIQVLSSYIHLQEVAAGADPAVPTALKRTPVPELELSVRARNCLLTHGIETVEELVCFTRWELANMPNMGRISVDEIENMLSRRGLLLGMKHRRIPSN
jgi:DNA-directed RNA polymerase subunit alpha